MQSPLKANLFDEIHHYDAFFRENVNFLNWFLLELCFILNEKS